VLPVAERPGSVPGVVSPPRALQRLGRKHPRLKITSARYRRPVLRVRGRLIRPKGVSKQRGCRGKVTITVKRGKHTLRKRRAAIRHKTCRFSKKLKVRTKAKRVTVRARFGGNAALAPAKAKARRVRTRH
jgi:hypothetical protein